MKAKFVNEQLEEDKSVIIDLQSDPRKNGRILKILKQFYSDVRLGGIGENGSTIITIHDLDANIEDVSDELAEYIEDGTIYSVDYL